VPADAGPDDRGEMRSLGGVSGEGDCPGAVRLLGVHIRQRSVQAAHQGELVSRENQGHARYCTAGENPPRTRGRDTLPSHVAVSRECGTLRGMDIPIGPEPTVTCDQCGRRIVVVQSGRGFPPDIAKRKLRKACRTDGCQGEPQYRAGILIGPRPGGQS